MTTINVSNFFERHGKNGDTGVANTSMSSGLRTVFAGDTTWLANRARVIKRVAAVLLGLIASCATVLFGIWAGTALNGVHEMRVTTATSQNFAVTFMTAHDDFFATWAPTALFAFSLLVAAYGIYANVHYRKPRTGIYESDSMAGMASLLWGAAVGLTALMVFLIGLTTTPDNARAQLNEAADNWLTETVHLPTTVDYAGGTIGTKKYLVPDSQGRLVHFSVQVRDDITLNITMLPPQ